LGAGIHRIFYCDGSTNLFSQIPLNSTSLFTSKLPLSLLASPVTSGFLYNNIVSSQIEVTPIYASDINNDSAQSFTVAASPNGVNLTYMYENTPSYLSTLSASIDRVVFSNGTSKSWGQIPLNLTTLFTSTLALSNLNLSGGSAHNCVLGNGTLGRFIFQPNDTIMSSQGGTSTTLILNFVTGAFITSGGASTSVLSNAISGGNIRFGIGNSKWYSMSTISSNTENCIVAFSNGNTPTTVSYIRQSDRALISVSNEKPKLL
jgi:hypothetical protein